MSESRGGGRGRGCWRVNGSVPLDAGINLFHPFICHNYILEPGSYNDIGKRES